MDDAHICGTKCKEKVSVPKKISSLCVAWLFLKINTCLLDAF